VKVNAANPFGKIRPVYRVFFWLAILSATVSLHVSAQSGRSTPPPSVTPSPGPATPGDPTAKSRPRIDPSAPRYRLVFPTYFEGVFRKGELYYIGDEVNRARLSIHDSFIEELNKAGAEGYRLISAAGAFPLAMVELDEVPYEYALFSTTGPMSVKTNFLGIYSWLAKRGYVLFADLLTGSHCEEINLLDSVSATTCTYSDLFLMGRAVGERKAGEGRLAFAGDGWRQDTGPELTTKIQDRIAQGFYPTHLLSRFEILVEKVENDEQRSSNQEVRVITSGWRDDLKKKVEQLAKQGFRLALVNHGIAVMTRNSGATPVSYVWLDARKKNFEQELARLQAQGAAYRMIYPTEEGTQSNLIFEQTGSLGTVRHEYRVLKLDFQYSADEPNKKVRKDLTPPGQEAIKQMNALVKDGFIVRDLFIAEEVGVLLERTR
jgi:hypothetical protein